MTEDTRAIIEVTYRREYGRVLAALISQLGDFTLAEDALHDALIVALERWETEGVPRNPGAWLTTIAKRKAIDRLRRHSTFARKQVILTEMLEAEDEDEEDMEESIPDERLKLMFTCCHPSLALDTQVALTLRTLGGLTTAEIARAFLVPVPTMAQRLARARSKISSAGIPYRVPPAHLLPERLDALLAVIYLIFNEGYVASGGDALIRHELCAEAIRLCRVLVNLLPQDELRAEAFGLLALMLLHDSRRRARVNDIGALVLLEDQDRSLWNQTQIAEGVTLLDQALLLRHPGAYQIQAAISALHAQADSADATDWAQIAELYGALSRYHDSPVIELNRAVAIAMFKGAQVGLHLLHKPELSAALSDYYPYYAALADLLRRSNQRDAAADAYEKALALCQNNLERAYLQRRLDEMLA